MPRLKRLGNDRNKVIGSKFVENNRIYLNFLSY